MRTEERGEAERRSAEEPGALLGGSMVTLKAVHRRSEEINSCCVSGVEGCPQDISLRDLRFRPALDTGGLVPAARESCQGTWWAPSTCTVPLLLTSVILR